MGWKLRRKGVPAAVSVQIVAAPEGAAVRIDDKVVCETPNCRISVAPGNYLLQVTKLGYEPIAQALIINAGTQSLAPVRFKLRPFKQALQVSTNFQTGKVWLNKKQIASLEGGQFLMQGLPIGVNLLEVRGPEGDASVTFEAVPGAAPSIKKLPESRQALAIVVSSLGNTAHVACNCTDVVALDEKGVGNVGPGGLDLKDIGPGAHQLKIGKGNNEHTVTIETGQAPELDVFLASDRNLGNLVPGKKRRHAVIDRSYHHRNAAESAALYPALYQKELKKIKDSCKDASRSM